jgi:hypothetical protein
MRAARAVAVSRRRPETDIVGDREMRKQRVVLEHHADAAAFRGDDMAGPADLFAADRDTSRGDLLESGDAPERGGLAAAARAEYAADPAAAEHEGKSTQHSVTVVAVPDPVDFE